MALRAEDFAVETAPLVRLDLGCGPNKKQDDLGEWTGVDSIAFEGVDIVADLCKRVYEWRPSSDPVCDEFNAGIMQVPLEKVHTGYEPWPWEDASVDEINCSHFLEHFGAWDRVHIFNEMHRILKKGAKVYVTVPSWTSARAYGDPTHQWAPMGTYGFWYLSKAWRVGGNVNGQEVPAQAPHTDAEHIQFGYSCDFDFTINVGMHPEIVNYNQERQLAMMTFNIEAVQDYQACLIKR